MGSYDPFSKRDCQMTLVKGLMNWSSAGAAQDKNNEQRNQRPCRPTDLTRQSRAPSPKANWDTSASPNPAGFFAGIAWHTTSGRRD